MPQSFHIFILGLVPNFYKVHKSQTILHDYIQLEHTAI